MDFDFVLDPTPVIMKENDADVALRDLESRLSEIISQTTKEDEEYQVQQKIYKNVSSNSNARKRQGSHKIFLFYILPFLMVRTSFCRSSVN